MKTLYLFIHTPNVNNINFINRLADDNDALLFIQNGVYAAKMNIDINKPVYFLKEDILARGIRIDEKQMIDYSGMIDLIFKYERIVTF